ncbi:rod shape-determining protein [bacterium]|nr:rod shape-determining protein [bacterium]
MGFFDYFSNDIGIDLGTANTLVYVKGFGIILNEPSVVAVDTDSHKVIAIGRQAKEMLGRTPGNINAVRPLKDGVIADFEMTEDMLREFIKRVIRKKFLVKPKIIISVPSGITEVEKRAVIETAENAGAREVFLVNEPMAAAIGVGVVVEAPRGNMVIDIGGGTSEIAVIALSGIVNNTSIRIAGDEMNEAIVQYLKKEHNLLIGEQTSEKVKVEIGSAFPQTQERSMDIKGRDLLSGIPKSIEVSSGEIREALMEPVNAVMAAIREALEVTPPELAADIMERGIIMTGGGSLLRGLDQKIRQETDLAVYVVDEPLKCVVNGTGVIIDNFDYYSKIMVKH